MTRSQPETRAHIADSARGRSGGPPHEVACRTPCSVLSRRCCLGGAGGGSESVAASLVSATRGMLLWLRSAAARSSALTFDTGRYGKSHLPTYADTYGAVLAATVNVQNRPVPRTQNREICARSRQ